MPKKSQINEYSDLDDKYDNFDLHLYPYGQINFAIISSIAHLRAVPDY